MRCRDCGGRLSSNLKEVSASITPVKKIALACALAVSDGLVLAADTSQCEVNRTVNFGGMNWESNLILVEVQRTILEKGYGCKTEVLSTETLPTLAAFEQGDLVVNTEVWLNSVAESWSRAEKCGRVTRVGDVFMGGESWCILKYTAERLPELKSAADLPTSSKTSSKTRKSPPRADFMAARPVGDGRS